VIYQSLTKTRTFKIEPQSGKYAIMEYRQSRKPKVLALYATRAVSEKELTLFAYDGFRRIE
jgi:hypothetical protein